MDSTTPAKKLLALKAYLNNLNSVAIAFSSGVDSTFLLKVAHDVLGDQIVAVTARSCSFPVRELKEAEEFCRKEGIRHIIVDSEELDIEGFRHNPRNRCYLCKHELFTKIIAIAQENHLAYVAEGSNMDDNGDYRPGLKAVAELHVVSPLRYVGLYKEEIRQLKSGSFPKSWGWRPGTSSLSPACPAALSTEKKFPVKSCPWSIKPNSFYWIWALPSCVYGFTGP